MGYDPLYGYVVFNTGKFDPNTNLLYAPTDMPDLSATAPTTDISGLTDYFTSSTLSSSWSTNVDFGADWTVTNKNNCLVITSGGRDSASSGLLVKTIPYPTNDWSAVLTIVGVGAPSMVSNGVVATTGLGCMLNTNSTLYAIDYASVKGQTNAYTLAVENVPQIWLNSCHLPTVARTNVTVDNGVNVIPWSTPQVALGLSYVASTKVLTYKIGSVIPTQPVSLKTISTITLPANPANVVISLYENDTVGVGKAAPKRVIKAFQFNQPSQ